MGREGKKNSERVCALKGKPADDVKNNLEEGREARREGIPSGPLMRFVWKGRGKRGGRGRVETRRGRG